MWRTENYIEPFASARAAPAAAVKRCGRELWLMHVYCISSLSQLSPRVAALSRPLLFAAPNTRAISPFLLIFHSLVLSSVFFSLSSPSLFLSLARSLSCLSHRAIGKSTFLFSSFIFAASRGYSRDKREFFPRLLH